MSAATQHTEYFVHDMDTLAVRNAHESVQCTAVHTSISRQECMFAWSLWIPSHSAVLSLLVLLLQQYRSSLNTCNFIPSDPYRHYVIYSSASTLSHVGGIQVCLPVRNLTLRVLT